MVFNIYSFADADSLTAYEKLYDQLIELKADPSSYIKIENFTLKRDVAAFELIKGDFFFCEPINDRVFAAAFHGDGVFHYSPPITPEKEQLFRFRKEYSLSEAFNFIFFIFGDTTYRQIKRKFMLTEKKVTYDIKKGIRYALKYMGEKKEKSFNYEVMKTLLEGQENGLFYIHFSRDDFYPLFFSINPFEIEEVTFMRRRKDDQVNYLREVINQFHIQEDYLSGENLSNENNAPLDLTGYKINSVIRQNLEFQAEVELTYRSRTGPQKHLYFWLHPELEVDSVFWSNGKKIPFFKGKKNPILWLESPQPILSDEKGSLRIFYKGDILRRENDWIYFLASNSWYPRAGPRDLAKFDIKFETPEKYRFACVGELLSADTSVNVVKTHWVPERPIRNASFNIGNFKQYDLAGDTIPPVTVFIAESAHDYLARSAGLFSSRNMEKRVANDVANSLAFFKRVYGEYPVNKFYVTEIPYIHGQAFPGLIHLSWVTFFRKSGEGFNEIFRAHEVAHQWWGIGVDIKTYHDQWLSEGMAQFSGLWYLHHKLKEDKKYIDILKEWRENILSNRKYLFDSGQEAGPIWMGYRTSSSNTEGDYNLIIYRKGAWVMHMLRMMMMDWDSKNDQKFIDMMRDFYQSNFQKKVCTDDFQQVVEKHLGEKMEWYFNQWIYGTDIPTYKYAYKASQSPSGEYIVQLRVKQEDCAQDFKMLVPVKIEFKKQDPVYKKIWIEGFESVHEISEITAKPRKIILNCDEAVLCKVKKEKWD